jgi:hypothetical protein
MHRTFPLLASLLLAVPLAAQWTSLSPAKSITEHWQAEGAPADIWSLRGGVIHCQGEPNGFLRSRKSYRNYVFRAEWRFVPEGWQGAPRQWPNAGFFIHARETVDDWPRSLEVQGHYGEAGSMFGVRGGAITGARRGPIVKNRVPFGDWDRYEIVARNGWVRVILNGEIVNEGFAASPADGHICLQSEGWPVEYRNLQILELGDDGRPDTLTLERELLDVARVAILTLSGTEPDAAALRRLTRLTGYTYDISLWRPVTGAKRVRRSIAGERGISVFAENEVELSFEIRKVFDPGQRMTISSPSATAVIAPLLDASGKPVAMLEIATR